MRSRFFATTSIGQNSSLASTSTTTTGSIGLKTTTCPTIPIAANHQGYNIYVGQHLTPEARLTVGRLREDEISSQKIAAATRPTAFFAYDRDHPQWGRLRFFNSLKKVRDNIPDVRREPTLYLQTVSLALVEDILPARDTWVNDSYVQFDYEPLKKLNVINKFKYSLFSQRGQAFKSGDAPILNESTQVPGFD